ncbi:MAG: hypothetical protein F6K35_50440 [Okeania sp. SIO2H7]|nr:hypothetical protein [Okeania sp. SIO2H7]
MYDSTFCVSPEKEKPNQFLSYGRVSMLNEANPVSRCHCEAAGKRVNLLAKALDQPKQSQRLLRGDITIKYQT